jgi:uncharacterized lipoprotein YddW (UPF0748 family)
MLAMFVGFFPAMETIHAAEENPMRAIWLRPKETTKEQVEEHVQQIKDAGLNTIFLETVFNGYTIFPVEYDATYQNPDYDEFDVLQAYIDACHSRGMQLHCWVESFFIGMQREDGGGPVMRAHKDWLLTDKEGNNWEDTMYGKMYFFNPARPECREWIVGLYEILCTNYDLDGIQLDYVRYPQKTKEKDYGYDDYTINAFMAEKGYDPREFKSKSFEVKTFEYYKQQQVTEFVRMCSTRLRKIKPELILSLSVYPFFDDGREQFMQSAGEWMEKGYGDLVVPMAYYENAVASLTKDAIKLAGDKANAVIGVSAQNGFTAESLKTQMEEVLKQGAGVAVFEFESYFANYATALNGTVLTNTLYDLEPAVYATKVERAVETPTPTPAPTLAPSEGEAEVPQTVPGAQYGPTAWIIAAAILVGGCGLVVLFVVLALRTPKKEKK